MIEFYKYQEGYSDFYLNWLDSIFYEKGYAYEYGFSFLGETLNLLESDYKRFTKEIEFPKPERYFSLSEGILIDLDASFAEEVYHIYKKNERFHQIVRKTKEKS